MSQEAIKLGCGITLIIEHGRDFTDQPEVRLVVEDLVPGRDGDHSGDQRIEVKLNAGEVQWLQLRLMTPQQRAHVHRVVRSQVKAVSPSTGPNDPCPCGSGKKFKRCHSQ